VSTTVTLRPQSYTDDPWSGIYFAVVGAGSKDAVVRDNSDANYLKGTALEGISFGFTNSIPATAQIRSVRPYMRFGVNDIGGSTGHYMGLGVEAYATEYVPLWAPWQMFYGSTRTTKSGGAPWTKADIDAIRVNMNRWSGIGGGGNEGYISEVYLEVTYNEAPVATVTTPVEASTIPSTTPTVAWNYSDPDGDGQERYRVRVFSAAQYGIGGFDPATSPATWDSGEVYSAATSVVVGAVLAQGTTYRAYVQVADAGSGGRYSAWDSNTFTVASAVSGSAASPGVGPALPTIVATADQALARIGIAIQTRDNLLTFNQSSAEADTEGWVANANCAVTRSTAQFAEGVASFAMTATAGGDMSMRTPNTGATGVMPVTAGQTYTAQARLRANTTGRTVRVEIVWLTAADAFISSTVGAGVADTNAGFTQVTASAIAPPTAARAYLIVMVVAAGAGEVHYVDMISLAPGASTTWTPGGFVAGLNMLLADQATAELGITGWAGTNATLSRSTLQDFDGVASLALTASSAATMSASTPTGAAGKPVTPGQVYSATAQMLAQLTPRSCSIGIAWYTAAGAFISTTTGTARNDATGAWTRVFVAGIAPATAAFAALVITVTSPANAEVHHVDRVQLAKGVTDLWLDPAVTRRRWLTLEASDNAGVTWFTIPRTVVPALDADLTQAPIQLYDYESLDGVARIYHAKVSVEV
jgi:hypothetical protein